MNRSLTAVAVAGSWLAAGAILLASPAPDPVLKNPTGSQTIEQPAGTQLNMASDRIDIRAGDPDDVGEVVISKDSKDSVHSIINQTGDQYHLRISAGTDKLGTGRGRDLLIGPYNYGMAVEHIGVLEFWVGQFSVHNHPSYKVPDFGAWFWVGDEIDAGGLFATAHHDPDHRKAFVKIAADDFAHLTHGSLHLEVRDPADAIRFKMGPFFFEKTLAEVGRDGAQRPYLGVFGDTVKGFLTADDSGPGALRLTSDQAERIELRAGTGSSSLTLLAPGSVELGKGVPGSAVHPPRDAQVDLGRPDRRWSELHAARIRTSAAATGLNQVASSRRPLFDAALGNTQKIVLAEDVESSELINAAPGQILAFVICQDGTGKHKFSWPGNVRGGVNVGLQAGTCSAQSFVFDGDVAWATTEGRINQ